MNVIYENQVQNIGSGANDFKESGMIILFGDSAPDSIKDFCYSVNVNPINGTIAAGQTMKFGDSEYKITAVGEEAPVTLAGLGHCTINFSGATEVELPGTIYLESKPQPEIVVGTTIQIIEG